MNQAHGLLILLWIGYCFIHSFMASISIKNSIQKLMGANFKYYRPMYSIFATITLVLILWFQFSIPSSRLFNITAALYLPGIVLATTGFTIMLACIHKYFYELSGLQAIQHSGAVNTLQQRGLHKYVRHPLYLGTLLFIWGIFFILPFMSNLAAVAIINAYILIGIRLEEKKLQIEYGESYRIYAKKIPRLIPHFNNIRKGSV